MEIQIANYDLEYTAANKFTGSGMNTSEDPFDVEPIEANKFGGDMHEPPKIPIFDSGLVLIIGASKCGMYHSMHEKVRYPCGFNA